MERIELTPEQIAEIRWHKSRAAVTLTATYRAAGIDGRGAYIPIETSIDEHGMLIARVVELDDDDPIPDDGVAITVEGDSDRGRGPALTSRIPNDVLEQLGYDLEAIRADERPPLTTFAGDGFVGFARTPNKIVEVPDRAPDGSHLSPESREDLLRVYHDTEGDIATAAEKFAISEAEARQAFADADLIDEGDTSG